MLSVARERGGFEQHLRQQGRAAATVLSYLHALDVFAAFMKARDVMDLRAVTPADVDAFQISLGGGNLAVQTQRTRLRGLKRFFEHMVAAGKLFASPAEHLRDPKEPRPPARPLCDADLERLMAAPDVNRPAGVRDRAIFELLRATGISRAELCGLMVYDVDLDGGQLRIRGGNRERLVAFDENAERWLKRYVKLARPRHAKRDAVERHLFLTTGGAPLSPNTVWGILQRYRAETGVPVSCRALARAARAAQGSAP